MGVIVADNQGAIDKSVGRIMVADAQGGIDKEVQNGYVSHIEGSIARLFYANWKYYTGTILHSSSGGGNFDSSTSLTPDALDYDIKPAHIQTAATIYTVDGGTSATVRLEVRYLNSSGSWETITSTTRTVEDNPQTIALDFDVSGDIVTKQLNYRMVHLGGEPVEYSSFYGKCTAWYKKG